MSAPDLTGEVLAWRDWQVTAYGDLTSRNSHAVWRPGPNRAICAFGGDEKDHTAPQADCDCGFYGLHAHGELRACKPAAKKASPYSQMFSYMSFGGTDNPIVRGLFAAWGDVIVHHSGIRAEWAELVALVHPNPNSAVKRASGYYDIPLFSDENEALCYATDKGYSMTPDELRPEAPKAEENPYLAYMSTPSMHYSMPTWTTSITTSEDAEAERRIDECEDRLEESYSFEVATAGDLWEIVGKEKS